MDQKFKYLQRQSGFTLVEVVASIVLLSLILIGFFQLIVQSNEVAHHNTNRLVLINLADAELERLQALNFKTIEELDAHISKHTAQTIAGKQYNVKIEKEEATQIKHKSGSSNEAKLNLYNVIVTVQSAENRKSSSAVSEGYVTINAK